MSTTCFNLLKVFSTKIYFFIHSLFPLFFNCHKHEIIMKIVSEILYYEKRYEMLKGRNLTSV